MCYVLSGSLRARVSVDGHQVRMNVPGQLSNCVAFSLFFCVCVFEKCVKVDNEHVLFYFLYYFLREKKKKTLPDIVTEFFPIDFCKKRLKDFILSVRFCVVRRLEIAKSYCDSYPMTACCCRVGFKIFKKRNFGIVMCICCNAFVIPETIYVILQ